jgi:taurine dioxygenase
MSFYRDFNDKTAIAAWNAIARGPFETIKVSRLSPTIGAEISGVDLSGEISDAQFTEIRRALDENLALIFRDQRLEREAQKAFAKKFGGVLHRHELATSRGFDAAHDPEFLAWRTGPESRYTAGDGWHPDVSCDPEPIFVSLLHVTKTPTIGGDTVFANAYLAYESLSEPFKAFLDGLTAIHDGAEGWSAG